MIAEETVLLCIFSILTDDIFQEQIPSNDESDELSHCGVAVDVRRAGLGNSGPELGVAQT